MISYVELMLMQSHARVEGPYFRAWLEQRLALRKPRIIRRIMILDAGVV